MDRREKFETSKSILCHDFLMWEMKFTIGRYIRLLALRWQWINSGYIYNIIPYGQKFWRGIYFGGLAVLRTICQYFIRKNFTLLCHHYCKIIACVYLYRPAAKCASLIVGMESPLKAASKDISSPKSFVHRRRRVGLSVNMRKAIQMMCTRSL